MGTWWRQVENKGFNHGRLGLVQCRLMCQTAQEYWQLTVHPLSLIEETKKFVPLLLVLTHNRPAAAELR